MSRKSQSDPMLNSIVMTILFIPVGIGYLIWLAIKGLICLYHQNKTRLNVNDIDLNEVDSMDGISFENFVAELLKKNKYSNVRVTKASGDFGVDVLANKDGRIWAIQCKCYQGSVGVHAIQEVYSGASKYGADVAVVITNSYFTAAAKEMARDLKVVLWNREDLSDLINSISMKQPSKLQLPQKDNKNLFRAMCINVSQESNVAERREPFEMATLIGTGKYVFGEDIPLGKYNLKVISGNGMLVIRYGRTEDDEDWINLGVNPDFAHEYRNISLPQGRYFSIGGNLQVEISVSKMLEID